MINKRVSSIGLSSKELPYKNEPKHPKHLSAKHYKNIMNLFFKKVVYYMIKDGVRFTIPHMLGALQILRYPYDKWVKEDKLMGRKRKPYTVNYGETKKLKQRGIDKIVKHKCKTTGGYWWKVKWFKKDFARFSTQKFYSFKFTRPNIRPNSYNPKNPEISIVPYFRDKGWEIYAELPHIYKKDKT